VAEPRPWRVLKEETVLAHAPWLRVVRQSVQLPNGAVIDDYYLTPGRDFSMAVAVTDAGEVLLVRQYKHGLGKIVLEFPAGYLDSPAEEPLACAQRELREETGYAARAWTALGRFCLDPNRGDTMANYFLARGLTRVAEPRLDVTENLQNLTVPAREIDGLLRSGAMANMACAAAWGLAAPQVLK
jgi:ADP-ribose pyrophosphatase YjhB (NUDIX family)